MIPARLIFVATVVFSVPLAAGSVEVLAFVQKSCTGCHNEKVKSGDLDLKVLETSETFEHDREIWEKVVEKLKAGQMPPPGSPRPPASIIATITHWLESEF